MEEQGMRSAILLTTENGELSVPPSEPVGGLEYGRMDPAEG